MSEEMGRIGLRSKDYILYSPRPVPESHMGGRNRIMGLRSARRQRLEDRIKAIESRDRTNPHTSEYERFHLPARLEAKRLEAAVASLPRSPSIEKTNGVKVLRRAINSIYHKYVTLKSRTENRENYWSVPCTRSTFVCTHSTYKS